MKKIRHLLLVFSLVLLLTLTPSFLGVAQNQTLPQLAQSSTVSGDKIDGFPVILDGKTIFLVRRGIGSFSPEERANAITNRIEKVAQDNSVSLENLKIEKNPEDNYLYLKIGKEIILTITPRDAKAHASRPDELAEEALLTIKAAIQEYRKEREPTQLIQGIIYTVIASGILIVISLTIIKLSGILFPAIRHWIESRIPGLRIQNFELVSSQQISLFFLRIFQLIRLFFLLFIFYFYITFILRLFPWTKAIGDSILTNFFQAWELVLEAISKYLPNVFVVAVIIIITYYLVKFIKPFFKAIERGNLVIPGFYPDWSKPTYDILRFLIIALAAVVAFPYLPGFDSPAFRGISVFLGLLFSLCSTSAIANVVGGIILIYTRAFQLGDRIQIGDVIGDVIEKTLLVVRIRTPTNKVITIPNSSLLSSNVVNFSVSSREFAKPLILQTTITLGYDLPWRKVHDTLIKAALATEHILQEPAPFVLQTSLDDFYVSYQLNAYTDRPDLMMIVYSELHQNIQDKCNEVGIEIMSPHYASLRDGNTTTIPENYLPSDYAVPPFRIQSLDE